MDPLVRYYVHQAGRDRGGNGIGPIYSNSSFLQIGHGFGSILGMLWRSFVCPLLWQCAKAMGSEAIVTGRNIITDMAQNTDPKPKIRDIVRRNMAESVHRVIKKMSGQGRKRKSATSSKREGKVKKAKKQPVRGTNKTTKKKKIKRNIFS